MQSSSDCLGPNYPEEHAPTLCVHPDTEQHSNRLTKQVSCGSSQWTPHREVILDNYTEVGKTSDLLA